MKEVGGRSSGGGGDEMKMEMEVEKRRKMLRDSVLDLWMIRPCLCLCLCLLLALVALSRPAR